MKYKYKDIYLEETIEKIFSELNNSNTEYERSTFSLAYRPYENIACTMMILKKFICQKNIRN